MELINLLKDKDYIIVGSIDYDSGFERIHSLGLTDKTKETFTINIDEYTEKDIILLNYLGKLYAEFIK